MPRSLYGEPRTALVKWLADSRAILLPEMRARLLSNPFRSALPFCMSMANSVMVLGVGYLRLGDTIFLAIACVEMLLLAVRMILRRRIGKPADPLFLGGVLWALLQAFTIVFVVLSQDVVMLVLTLATNLAIVGGIIARNFAMPRYALLQVFLIDASYKLAFLYLHPVLAPVILVQTVLFLAYNLVILKQQRSLAFAAMKAEIESRKQAFTDTLTGLLNRRGLAAHTEGMASKDRSLVLFYIDLDGFKAVNDRQGHLAGDHVLKEVARRLHEAWGPDVPICRFGGDEFLVLRMLETDEEVRACGAHIVAILSAPYAAEAGSLSVVGASVGAARWAEEGGSLDACIVAADAALYRAKAAGKGCCVIDLGEADQPQTGLKSVAA